jgi:hypothetical protein
LVQQKSSAGIEQFGYKPEFDRTLRRFASFAIGFSFISITTGIFTTYGSVLISSGPLGIWTWPLVIVGQVAVALVFGALSARIPLAGYSYQWMSRLANPYIGWLVGWFVFAFLIVDVVAVDYALASTVIPALFSYVGTMANIWAVTAVIVAAQGLLILLSTVWSERVNNTAVMTEIVGIGGLTILILIVAAITGKLTWGHLFSKAAIPAAGYFGFGGATHDTRGSSPSSSGRSPSSASRHAATWPRRQTSQSGSCPGRCGCQLCCRDCSGSSSSSRSAPRALTFPCFLRRARRWPTSSPTCWDRSSGRSSSSL